MLAICDETFIFDEKQRRYTHFTGSDFCNLA
jgi:hypothetical protein